MLPCNTMNSSPNTVSTKTVFSGERRNCYSFRYLLSKFTHEIIRQNVIVIFFSRMFSSFFRSVSAIILISAEEKMLWIDTGRIITIWTIVKNMKSFWNLSFQKQPRNSWRSVGSKSAEKSITVLVSKSCPKPTGVGFIDESPEPFRHRSTAPFRSTFTRAEKVFVTIRMLFLANFYASVTIRFEHLKLFLLGVKGLAASTASSAIFPNEAGKINQILWTNFA